MALKGFMTKAERGSETTTETAKPVQTVGPSPRTVAPSTSVDASTKFEGTLRCDQTLRIDGEITGEVECRKTIVVGEGARVLARVTADEVTISGYVEGDITAHRKITLQRTATVVGDLTTPGIVIEEGAKLKGRILIGSNDEIDAEDTVAAKDAEKSQVTATPKSVGAKKTQPSTPQPVAASA
jgi:cytoskeletal protein CcmA (bactofilin family)